MARSRNIKPGFFANEELGECEPLARLLFAGLWTVADREGRLEYRPKRIKVEVLPYDDCDIAALLQVLERKGFITIYEVGEAQYVQVNNWKKHQNPHVKENASTIPAPDLYQTCTRLVPDNTGASTGKKVVFNENEKNKGAENPDKSTVSDLHHTSTILAPDLHGSSPADSLNLIPDSLISDSFPPHPLTDTKEDDDEDDVREAQKALAMVMYNCDSLRSGFEMQEVNRWLSEFPAEVVMEAIRKIGLSGSEVKRPMTVIDRQLWEWRGKGLATVEAIRNTYAAERPTAKKETQRERVERMMQERERRQASG